MSKKKILLIVAVIAVAIAALTVYMHRTNENQTLNKWIMQEVSTENMDAIRTGAENKTLMKAWLVNQSVTEGDTTLYNMLYYPEASTVIATVTEPIAFSGRVSPYLVSADGSGVAGWYQPSVTRNGIMKIVFETLFPNAIFEYLDLVDTSTISGVYDPNAPNPTRVRIPLNHAGLAEAEYRDAQLAKSSAAASSNAA